MTMRITLLFEPSAERKMPFAAGAERYRRFSEELGQYAGTLVPVVEGFLRNAPEDTYILFAGNGDLSHSLAGFSPDRAARLCSRIVLVDVSWQQTLKELERHRLAGAVDSLRMSEWLARPSSCKGPFGLRYLAKALGVSCASLPWFQSRHYCRLDSDRHRGMPHLLADYLTAYDRDQTPLTALPSVALARLLGEPGQGTGGAGQKTAGRNDQSIPTSQVEFVSTKRTVASIKRVRELAGMTLPQVAEIAGLDPESLALLEGGDYLRATLGMLHGYVLALEPQLGWTLAEAKEAKPAGRQKTSDRSKMVATGDQSPIIVSGTGGGEGLAGAATGPGARMPWVIQGGMTVLRIGRIRRRQPEGEIDKPLARRHEEEFYAGV
jgi:hypothetical protein